MAKTGQPAYDSGMRGSETPKDKKKAAGGKRKIKRISIEAAKTGHIVEVERHPKPAKANEPLNFMGPERHAHSSKQAAMTHVNDLMDELAPDGDEQ